MFKKAERKRVKLRLAIEGPSGSGKSHSALIIARGLVGPDGKIAVLDSENESASLYVHLTDFDTAPLVAPFTPERYIAAITEAAKAGYDALIIDSITHEWSGKGGCLEIHDALQGNSFANWGKVTPRHDAFIQAMMQAPLHIIVTMRSKETYTQTEDSRGKTKIEKAGEAPQQRQGIAYEFTTVLTMNAKHYAEGTKDRTGLFLADHPFVPTVETGEALRRWLDTGAEDPRSKTYNLGEVEGAMSNLHTLNALTEYLQSLAVPRGHPQLVAIGNLYKERKAQIEAMNEDGPEEYSDPNAIDPTAASFLASEDAMEASHA